MDVREFLSQDDMREGESGWLDLAKVSIPSGELVVADPSLYPDGVVVQVCPGRYRVQVAIRTEFGTRVVSRLRAYSSEHHLVAQCIGEVSVDFARIGIGDNVPISDAAKCITLEMAEPIWQAIATDELIGSVPWNEECGVVMPFVVPGDGDGRYEVHELRNGQSCVGVQVEFFTEP